MLTNFRAFTLLLVATVTAVAAATKADVTSGAPLGEERLSPRIQQDLLRIIQEAISNALRHAKPTVAQLLASRFPGKLSLSEEKLAYAAANGEPADCSKLSGEDRKIRGDLLSWFCTDRDASAQITNRGVIIIGAEIVHKIDLQWAKIAFPIGLIQCVVKDSIILSNAQISFLNLEGSSVRELNAATAHFEGSLYLRNGFKAEAGVNIVDATIDKDVDCGDGQFIGKGVTPALNAERTKVNGNLYLAGDFQAKGVVYLLGAQIDGYLYCDGGHFVSEGETPALYANGVEVKRGVFLRKGFSAQGGVTLVGAKIDGYLDCDGGQFISKGETPALNAESAKIDGGVYCRAGFAAEGEVKFLAAYVGRDFQWSDVKSPEKSTLDLRYSKVGTLLNSENSWPTQGRLRVDGFVYDQFDDGVLPDAKVQLGWLQLQPQGRFVSQPFEQLAAVLRRMGLEEDARIVMIAKNEEHARYLHWRPEWLWYGLLGKLIGYGYRSWRAFVISIAVIGIGWWLFWRGYRRGLVTPTGDVAYTVKEDGVHPASEDYPKFNAFVYSLETFVPLVKLGLGEHWTPNGSRSTQAIKGRLRLPPTTGGWLRGYLWFHIIAGWLLTTLWVGGLTGLVKT